MGIITNRSANNLAAANCLLMRRSASSLLTGYSYDPLSRLTNVLANGSAAASYGFDLVGNLQAMRYGNGVTNLYQYDSLNRLTNLVWKLNASTLASFYYQLGLTGNRTNLVESVNTTTSRTNAWSYDPLYRLTNEVIKTTSTGTLGYGYDMAGNRTNRTISGLSLTNQSFTFNTNDWLSTDQYDANGNTTNSSSIFYLYDVMNHVTNVNNGAILITYDGDGNRASKKVGATTTFYLVDDRNPSGYAQVLEETTVTSSATNLALVYNYGLDLISQRQPNTSTNYYGYDGHGSTRFMTKLDGSITNTYTYDAYGMVIASTGTAPNNYLYCGEQLDPDLGFYYLRARYLNPNTGRFWTMDTDQGDNEDTLSLHKYLYGGDNPVNRIDPSGHDYIEMAIDFGIIGALASMLDLVTVGEATATLPMSKTIYYSVAPNNCPSTFYNYSSQVQEMLQFQLRQNVFNNLADGQRVEIRVNVEANPPGNPGWNINNSEYICRVYFGWGNVPYGKFAINDHEGNIDINLNPIVNSPQPPQRWVNDFAHEGIWGNVAGKNDINAQDGEISSGHQYYDIAFTVSTSSRLTILKSCGFTSK